MNPSTGEIRKFDDEKQAVSDGFTRFLSDAEAETLAPMDLEARKEWARNHPEHRRGLSRLHPSGMNRKQRRAAEKAAKRAARKGGAR